MTNRLGAATSPYLLQHRDNPVDWQEWGPEAFEEARRRNVPVLLSVGYAACHWCHVMAHESFEDETVAAALNAHFVSVKVDREERPDIDAVYMSAVTATTGHGGWPMTVFLTPEGDPFYCGTYFPRDHFLQVLTALDEAWRTREDEVRQSGRHIATALSDAPRSPATGRCRHRCPRPRCGRPCQPVRLARRRIRAGTEVPAVDGARVPAASPRPTGRRPLGTHGRAHARGHGPQRHVRPARRRLRALQRRRRLGRAALREDALRQRAAAPRLHLVVARDAAPRWPAGSSRRSPSSCCATSAPQKAASPRRSTRTPQASKGSPTHGRRPSSRRCSGADDAARAAELFVVTEAGTFEHGASTLQLPATPTTRPLVRLGAPAPAGFARDPSPAGTRRQGRDLVERPRHRRAGRGGRAPRTARLGRRRRAVRRPRARRAPRRRPVAAGLTRRCRRSRRGRGRRPRQPRRGAARPPPGDGRRPLAARGTGAPATTPSSGSAPTTAVSTTPAHDAESLYLRPRSAADNAEPSGQSALAGALVTLGALTGDPAAIERGRLATEAGLGLAARDPRFGGWSLAVAEAIAAGPVQVAVVGEGPSPTTCSTPLGAARAPARWWSRAPRTRTAYPCSRIGLSRKGARPPTCATASCATSPSPRSATSRQPSPER